MAAATPSIFSTIFGAPAAPSAADTKAATAEISGLSSTFSGMTSSLTSSVSAATALSPDLKGMIDTSALTSAVDATKNLQEMCKGLSTADCAKKQAQLKADSDAVQLKFFNDALAAQLKKLTKQRDKIQAQYDKIKEEKTAALAKGALVFKGEEIFPQYDDLLNRINADIATVENSKPYLLDSEEGFQDGSATDSGSAADPTSVTVPVVKPPYALPAVASALEYDLELDQIIAVYDSLIGNPFDQSSIIRRVTNFFKVYLIPIGFYVFLALIMIWSGIVCANIYLPLEKRSLITRLWYFFHGMLLFPGVIPYSLIYPPYWVSGIFPWYPLTEAGSIAAAPVVPDADAPAPPDEIPPSTEV